MKSVIEDFKEREREKEQLLIKIKQKDEKIKGLMKSEKSPKDTGDHSKMKDEVKRLKEENDRLNSDQASVSLYTYDSFFRRFRRWSQSSNRCSRTIRRL